jgi:hypothetical protein
MCVVGGELILFFFFFLGSIKLVSYMSDTGGL